MFQMQTLRKLLNNERIKPFLIPVVLLLLGVFILVITTNPSQKSVQETAVDSEKYIQVLEKNLTKNIKKLTSVYDCSVMITISSFDQNEYLENKSVTSTMGEQNEEYNREGEYLVIDGGGDDSVVIKSRKMPEIRGALVVYDGSADINTKKNILDAVSTVLGIQSNKVCVVSNQE